MPNVFKADVPSLHSTASPEDGPGAVPSFLTLTHAPNASLQQIAHEQVLSPGRVCLAQVPVLLGRMLVKERLIPMQPAANLPPLLHPLAVIVSAPARNARGMSPSCANCSGQCGGKRGWYTREVDIARAGSFCRELSRSSEACGTCIAAGERARAFLEWKARAVRECS